MLTGNLEQDIKEVDKAVRDCEDIMKREMTLGMANPTRACLYFIEVAVISSMLEQTILGELLASLWSMDEAERKQCLKQNSLGLSDAKLLNSVKEIEDGILAGDAVLLMEGCSQAVKIKVEGYPGMGITGTENEAVLRGSKEGFSDSVKSNTALIRKRLRTMDLKVKGMVLGEESNTNAAIVYLQSKARPEVVDAVKKRLLDMKTDGVMDSGIIEQMTEGMTASPFPQYQTTERPDRASMELLKGRVLILSDNSPVGLLLPADFAGFFHTPDDYYNRTGIVTLERLLRFFAAFLAMTLPGFYLAVISYHPEILPYQLLMTFIEARKALPFSSLAEVLFMEISFELLREAGVRVPGAMGSTIGIVGGLIIGDAAVSAGLVSPIIVIVVSVTALASFAVPNEEMSGAFRILKYGLILLAALFGLFGWLCGILSVLAHLSGLKSYEFPYLYPMAAGEINGGSDRKDSVFRYPLRKLRYRSLYQKREEK